MKKLATLLTTAALSFASINAFATTPMLKTTSADVSKTAAAMTIKPMQSTAMFIQTAKSGQIYKIKDSKNLYSLTLHDIAPYVNYFTDRPVRKTGLLPIDKFTQLWTNTDANNFKVDPPNVAIESVSIKFLIHRKNVKMVAEVTNPKYDAVSHSITYQLRFLTEAPNIKKPVHLGYTVLFFDSIHWSTDGF